MVLLQPAGNKSRRNIHKEDIIAEASAATGLLQLRDYFTAKEERNHPPIQHNPPTTTTNKMNKKNSNTSSTISRSSVAVIDHKIAKTRPNMNGQKRSRTDDGMKPKISAAKRLLQLCIEKSNRCDKGFNITPHMKEEVKHLRSHHIGLIDKFNKVHGDDEEGSKSDVSYITDDSSEMETTLAEISAAQQIMQLSNGHQQATTASAEDEEGSTGYNTASSGVVSSARKDFEEESNAFLRRKHKFRSLAELYEITQPLEDSTLID